MTMSLQFLAQETIEGVSLDWAEIPGPSKTDGVHRAIHMRYICLSLLKARAVRRLQHCAKSKKVLCLPVSLNAGCDARLGSTALLSLLPAATLVLGAKKWPDWIGGAHDCKTRQRTLGGLRLGVAKAR